MTRRPALAIPALLAGLLLASSLLPSLGRAIVAPTPTPVTLLADTVDPALCQIAPLLLEPTLATVAAIYRDGPPVVEAPDVLTVDTTARADVTIDGEPWVLDGRLVGEAAVEPAVEPLLPELERTLSEEAACENAGDAARFFALHTADGFARIVGDQDEEALPVDEWRTFLSQGNALLIGDERRVEPVVVAARSLSDGRVALFGVFTLSVRDFGSPDISGDAEPQLWVLKQEGDRWLIDRRIEFMRQIPVQLDGGKTPTFTSQPTCRAGRNTYVGRSVTFHCFSLEPGEVVALSFDSEQGVSDLLKMTADAEGEATGDFVIPQVVGGGYLLTLRRAELVRWMGMVTVPPSISLTPRNGTVGSTVAFTLRGFQSGESVSVVWYHDAEATTVVRRVDADATGDAVSSFVVPASTETVHIVRAVGDVDSLHETTFTLYSTTNVTAGEPAPTG